MSSATGSRWTLATRYFPRQKHCRRSKPYGLCPGSPTLNETKDDKKDQQRLNITPVLSPVLSQCCSVYPSIRRSFSELISCSHHQSFMILSLKSWIETERGKHALKHTRALNDGDTCGGLRLLPKDASQLRNPHRQVANLPIVQPHFDEGLARRNKIKAWRPVRAAKVKAFSSLAEIRAKITGNLRSSAIQFDSYLLAFPQWMT